MKEEAKNEREKNSEERLGREIEIEDMEEEHSDDARIR